MVLIEWRDEYRTGVEGVDHEHQELIEQINAVYASIEAGADRQQLIDRLGDIYGSISAHFALEDRTMQRHRYQHYEEHRADHDRLLDELRDITETLESENELDEAHFQQTLADWFQLHFKTHDSRLHLMLGPDTHDKASSAGMRGMIENAKHRLFGRG